jgi:hypothetical protein
MQTSVLLCFILSYADCIVPEAAKREVDIKKCVSEREKTVAIAMYLVAQWVLD